MDAELQRKVEETVLDILKSSDMDQATEYKIRAAAADRLGIDLSVPDRKRFVRGVVESFLLSKRPEDIECGKEGEEEDKQDRIQQQEPETENIEEAGGRKKREYDDDGDLIICHLSNKRRVSIQEFRGKTLVSIREFYEKDGKQLPSSKGISLTTEQWKAFKTAVPDVEDAIRKMKRGDYV